MSSNKELPSLSEIKSQISVNLPEKAPLLLHFLKFICGRKEFNDPAFIKQAAFRYEKLWLPLLQDLKSKELDLSKIAPPLDVHWIWHLHMLSPVSYAKDCTTHFGQTFGHSLKSLKELGKMRERTKSHWTEKYSDQPFDCWTCEADNGFESALEYNFEEAIKKQKSFFYQVSLPHYKDDTFLKAAFERYLKFLYLKSQNLEEELLVPCYDMDLMWQTHLMHPVDYEKDTTLILGQHLPHKDIEEEEIHFRASCDKTISLWNKTFVTTPYYTAGVRYRGDPPNEKLSDVGTQKFKTSVYTRNTYDISICGIHLDGLPWPSDDSNPNQVLKSDIKICVRLQTFRSDRMVKDEELLTLPWTTGHNAPFSSSLKHPVVFSISDSASNYLQISVQGSTKRKFLLWSTKVDKKTARQKSSRGFSLADLLVADSKDQTATLSEKMVVESGADDGQLVETECLASISLSVSFKAKKEANSASVTIVPGTPQEMDLPDKAESMWGYLPHFRQLTSKCNSVTHKLVDDKGNQVMTVSIMHLSPLPMTAIEIFVDEHLLMVCHLVGTDTIGNGAALGLTLNAKEPWRTALDSPVMLLKDNSDDVGICVASWLSKIESKDKTLEDFIDSIAGFSRTPELKSQGIAHCKIKYLNLRNERMTEIIIDKGFRDQGQFSLDSGCTVDLKKGRITIPASSESDDPIHDVAISVVIAVLMGKMVHDRSLTFEKWQAGCLYGTVGGAGKEEGGGCGCEVGWRSEEAGESVKDVKKD